MRDVAGVDHEGGLLRDRLDVGDRLFQRALGVRIGRLVEAHVAVADLQEGEALGVGGLRLHRPGRANAARRRIWSTAPRCRPRSCIPAPCGGWGLRCGRSWSVSLTRDAFRGLDRARRRFIPGWACGTAPGDAIYANAMKFLDEAKVYVHSGAGGNGCIAFRREKFIEFGGPSRRRRRQRRRRHHRGGRRPQHADRLPLPAALQGAERRQRHGQGHARRQRQGRGAESSGRHANLRRRRRDVARRSHARRRAHHA